MNQYEIKCLTLATPASQPWEMLSIEAPNQHQAENIARQRYGVVQIMEVTLDGTHVGDLLQQQPEHYATLYGNRAG